MITTTVKVNSLVNRLLFEAFIQNDIELQPVIFNYQFTSHLYHNYHLKTPMASDLILLGKYIFQFEFIAENELKSDFFENLTPINE